MKFKLNDEVKWSSSSNGVTKVKIGFIVEVIPPGVNVKKIRTRPSARCTWPSEERRELYSLCRSKTRISCQAKILLAAS